MEEHEDGKKSKYYVRKYLCGPPKMYALHLGSQKLFRAITLYWKHERVGKLDEEETVNMGTKREVFEEIIGKWGEINSRN